MEVEGRENQSQGSYDSTGRFYFEPILQCYVSLPTQTEGDIDDLLVTVVSSLAPLIEGYLLSSGLPVYPGVGRRRSVCRGSMVEGNA